MGSPPLFECHSEVRRSDWLIKVTKALPPVESPPDGHVTHYLGHGHRRLYRLAVTRHEVHRVKAVFYPSLYGIFWITYHVDSRRRSPRFNGTDYREELQKHILWCH